MNSKVETKKRVKYPNDSPDKSIDYDRLINIIINVVSDSFYNENLGHACLPASLILAKMLRKQGFGSKLIYGYFVCYDDEEMWWGRHVWLECGKQTIDIGDIILKKFIPNISEFRSRFIIKRLPRSLYKERNVDIEPMFDVMVKSILQHGEEFYWNFADDEIKALRDRLCKV